jgi:hypothetical protein
MGTVVSLSSVHAVGRSSSSGRAPQSRLLPSHQFQPSQSNLAAKGRPMVQRSRRISQIFWDVTVPASKDGAREQAHALLDNMMRATAPSAPRKTQLDAVREKYLGAFSFWRLSDLFYRKATVRLEEWSALVAAADQCRADRVEMLRAELAALEADLDALTPPGKGGALI